MVWYEPNADNPDAIVGGRLEEMFIDKDGYIWISTLDKGLERFDPETEIFDGVSRRWQKAIVLSLNSGTKIYIYHG